VVHAWPVGLTRVLWRRAGGDQQHVDQAVSHRLNAASQLAQLQRTVQEQSTTIQTLSSLTQEQSATMAKMSVLTQEQSATMANMSVLVEPLPAQLGRIEAQIEVDKAAAEVISTMVHADHEALQDSEELAVLTRRASAIVPSARNAMAEIFGILSPKVMAERTFAEWREAAEDRAAEKEAAAEAALHVKQSEEQVRETQCLVVNCAPGLVTS
jgi:hypothetical protein